MKPSTIRSMKSNGGGDDLPPELWRDIVSRLPVKSILRFRSVCKSWYSLISCPNFVSDYSINNPNKNGNRVLLQHFDRSYSFSAHDESFIECYDYGPDDVNNGRLKRIVGSCNGLICLVHDGGGGDMRATFRLWNPTIRKIVELPYRTSPHGDGAYNYFSYFGFGFDLKSRDYKVLCAARDPNKNVFPDFESECEIYDLSKGVWRGIGSLLTSCWPSKREQEFYLNGALHWIAHNNNVLLSSDLRDEIWREISMPGLAEFTLDRNGDPGCGTFDGLIYLMRWENGRVGKISSVWVMKEYGVTESWTKLFDIDMQSSPAFLHAKLRKFRLWRNDEILVVHHHQEVQVNNDLIVEFGLYNGESRIRKRIFSSTKILVDMYLYEESLFLM